MAESRIHRSQEMAKKILIVDDTDAHLQQMREIVSAEGHHVITASSGTEAVKKVAAENPDMVFLDIVMDDLDGYGACREITQAESSKDIPVVFVSTKKQRADKLWAEKQGAKALISKPFSAADIIDQIKLHT